MNMVKHMACDHIEYHLPIKLLQLSSSAMRASRTCRTATQYIRPSPPRSHPCITPADLHAHLTSSNPSPLLLPGLISHWPALQNWKPSNGLGNLRAPDVEDKLVDVELGGKGKSYMDPDHRRVQMPLGESYFHVHMVLSRWETDAL